MRKRIELLIVLLILLTCGGMFPSFLSKIRDAGDRAQCSNNLKGLALAIEAYHSANRQFPPAAEINPEIRPEKRYSWLVLIWPYIEAGPPFPFDEKRDHKAVSTPQSNFHCPAYPKRPPPGSPFSTHYLGIAGIGADALELPLEDNRAGFFGYDRIVTRKDLKDRADSILMLVETSRASGAWTAAGSPTTRGLEAGGTPYFGVEGQFGGNHLGGDNAVFADGSVRFIEQTIAPAVWEQMATLSGRGNGE